MGLVSDKHQEKDHAGLQDDSKLQLKQPYFRLNQCYSGAPEV